MSFPCSVNLSVVAVFVQGQRVLLSVFVGSVLYLSDQGLTRVSVVLKGDLSAVSAIEFQELLRNLFQIFLFNRSAVYCRESKLCRV